MTLFQVSRRALLLSIVVIVAMSLLIVAFLSFAHVATATPTGTQHHATHSAATGKSSNAYSDGAVPSWDAPLSDIFVFRHEMHQGNWYALNNIQSC